MATIKPRKVIIKKKAIQQPNITFTTMKEKGDAYEILIKHNLLDSGNYKQVYLWRDVPEADLFASGIMDDWNTARLRRKTARKEGLLADIGTDLLVLGVDDKYSIIQCKYYDEDARLRIEDLGTFYFMMMNYHQMVGGIVYHTSKLSHLLELHSVHNNLIQYKQYPFNPTRYLELLDTIYKPIKTESNTKLIPFDYQLEAITALQGKSRTVCQLPCGCGKTLIAIKLCEAYKQNVIITPLKSYCEQNLERFQSQMDSEYKMIIIDSDGDGRNLEKIQDFINKNEKICLFVTFKSVDIINKLVNNGILKDYYVVIDEFHNISINDILEVDEDFQEFENTNLEVEKESDSDEEIDEEEELDEDMLDYEIEDNELDEEDKTTDMYKLLHSDARILFMSATPRIYGDDNGYAEDCDIDEEIFGSIDYKMEMKTAIESGKICDYMIYVPTLSIEKTVGLDKIQEEVDICSYDKELVIKARFLLRGMMNNGSRRCIIYLQTKEECREMNTILADVGKNYFGIEINSNYIISDLGKDERKLVLKKFIEKTGYNFLCSVDILNECIDIPECDSIFIAYPSKSKIRNIQRVCRANRKDKKNPDKVARIYVLADEYKNDLVDFISHLKEYDETFTFEKVKRINVHGKRNAIMKPDVDSNENKKLEGLVVGVKGIDSWEIMLENAYTIMRNYNKRPSSKSNNKEESRIASWIARQEYNYKTKKSYMTNINYYEKYGKFRIEFYDLIKSNDDIWFNNRNNLHNFILLNKRLPYNSKKNSYEKKLWQWMRDRIHQENYNKFKDKKKEISWKELKLEFNNYFITLQEAWKTNFNNFDVFLSTNQRLPKENNNKYEKKLKNWYYIQEKSLKFNLYLIKRDTEIKQMYINLKNKYPTIMLSFEELWKLKLNKIIDFKLHNKKLPCQIRISKSTNQIKKDENSDALWLKRQDKSYLKNNINFREYPEIKTIWEKFRNENLDYFKTYDEKWKDNLILYKKCLDNNLIIFNKKYTDKYSKLWYINEILPNKTNSLYYINRWASRQQSNSKNNKDNMKNNKELRQLWIETTKIYGNLFPNDEDEFAIKLEIIEQFIIEYKRLPMDTVKCKIESVMRNWFRQQIINYKKQERIFKIEKTKDLFKKFIDKYQEFL